MTTTEAKADFQKQIDAMKAKFKDKARTVHSATGKAVANCCAIVERAAKKGIQNSIVDENTTYGRRGHHPSIPGSPFASDTGMALRSITHDVDFPGEGRIVGRVGSTIVEPPYPAYLENGTSNMAPRPWLLPALDESREAIKEQMYKALEQSRGNDASD